MTHPDLERMKDEMTEIVDENDKVIEIMHKNIVRQENLRHRGTGIFVVNSNGELLITKRSHNRFLYPNLLEICQGGSVAHGETYKENAIKEIREETGIKNVELEFIFKTSFEDDFNKYIAEFFRCTYDGPITVDGIETESFFWIAIPELMEMIHKRPELFTPDCPMLLQKYLEWFKKNRE